MELGVMEKQLAALARPETLFPARRLGIPDPFRGVPRPCRIRHGSPARSALREAASVSIAGDRIIRSVEVMEKKTSPIEKKIELERLFVGLPLDVVSANNAINHSKAIVAGLRALALLGVYGVELPISWGVVSNSGDWSSYLAISAMAHDAGLRLRVSLHLHAHTRRPCLPLPKSVDRAVASNIDLLFTDRCGRRHSDCLSFAVDDLRVLDGRTPMEMYEEFFEGFRLAFADLIGSTVTDITIGLGPNGELRYPSLPCAIRSSFNGVGEFQCYDNYMLADLKRHAEESGLPLWGLAGPHDAPEYNQSPDCGKFFNDHGGSWETPYGQFFLSWYSSKLLCHCDRLLSVASKVFSDLPVTLLAKVPLQHRWHNTRSRPDQLTAGFFNTVGRDGYDAVAKIFAKCSFTMIIPCMDLVGVDQADSLISEIMHSCRKHGVMLSGENSSTAGVGTANFCKIKERFSSKNSSLDSFAYHRMGAEFFSPEHWPLFRAFVRSMKQPAMYSDDVPNREGSLSLSVDSELGNNRKLQAV